MVNAMWDAGAEAITIQGQRVISTTGIKCAGNSVELHGIPYPQPYVIRAVGDPTTLQERLDSDPYVLGYRRDAAEPEVPWAGPCSRRPRSRRRRTAASSAWRTPSPRRRPAAGLRRRSGSGLAVGIVGW